MGQRKDYRELGMVRAVTFSTHRKLPLLKPGACAEAVQRSLIDCRQRLGIDLYAFAIMSNHVHFVFALREEPVELAKIFMFVKNSSAKKILRELQEVDPVAYESTKVVARGKVRHRVWMAGGGYDRSLPDRQTIYAAIDYVHNNPVKAGLVSSPEEYSYTSAGDILTGRYAFVDPLLL